MESNEAPASPNKALAGIRVLHFAQFGAGPTCGMLLGDMADPLARFE